MIPGVGPFLAMVPAGGWKVIGLVFAIGAGTFYIDRHATNRERAKCNTLALEAQLAARTIERDAFREQVEQSR